MKYKQEWRDGEKAGKVSLLRDIHIEKPHSGHERILTELQITTTETKTDPMLTEGVKIGPLCRKSLLIEQQLITTNPLSLSDVLMFLKDPSFDALTSAAITHYQIGTNHLAPLLKK